MTPKTLLAPPRMSRCWLVHWLTIPPTVRRYSEAVPLARVLGEHHGAVAAEPMDMIERASRTCASPI